MGDARLVVPADCILHGIFVPKLDESNCFLLSVVVIDWNFDTDYLHEKKRLVNPQETYGGGRPRTLEPAGPKNALISSSETGTGS